MSITVAVTGVTLNPLTIEVLLTHSGGQTRTFVASRTDAVPFIHTGTRLISDEELAAWVATATRAQKRAVLRSIVESRLPEERVRLLALVNAPASAGPVATEDLPPSFTVADA